MPDAFCLHYLSFFVYSVTIHYKSELDCATPFLSCRRSDVQAKDIHKMFTKMYFLKNVKYESIHCTRKTFQH